MDIMSDINIPMWNQKVLTGRNAVITGGTSGIGLEMAKTFLSADCRKLVITSRNKEKLDNTVSELRKLYEEKANYIFGVILELDEIDSYNNVVKEIITVFEGEPIDIWVNNAGIYKGTRFGNVSSDDFDILMDVNLKSQVKHILDLFGIISHPPYLKKKDNLQNTKYKQNKRN